MSSGANPRRYWLKRGRPALVKTYQTNKRIIAGTRYNIRKSIPISKRINTMRLKTVANVASGPGGAIQFTYANDPTIFSEFSTVAGLYDSYKFYAIRFQYFPHLPNDTSVTTGFTPIYWVMDPDSAALSLTTVQQAVEYGNMKAKNLYRPFTIFYRFPKITQAPGSTYVTLSNGYQDINGAGTIDTSSVAAYADGLDISTTYGELIITGYFKFKNRR